MSEFIVTDENINHNNFTILQNILSHLGLTAFERSLYWALREAAGDKSSCTKSYSKLAEISGMSEKSVQRTMLSLSQKKQIVDKPLIKIKHRLTEDGDKNTNEVTLTNLWGYNYEYFKNISSPVTQTGPKVRMTGRKDSQTGGVESHRPDGPVTQTDKEDTFKNIPFKKTTSTPTPSRGKDVEEVVSKYEITTHDKEAARSLKEWLDKESFKTRSRKSGRSYENIQWGNLWVIPLNIFEMLIAKYGLLYFKEQLENMHRQQMDFDKGISKKPILKPETVLKMSCKNNYAEYVHLK